MAVDADLSSVAGDLSNVGTPSANVGMSLTNVGMDLSVVDAGLSNVGTPRTAVDVAPTVARMARTFADAGLDVLHRRRADLSVDAAAEESFAVVDREDLPGSQRSLRFMKAHECGAVAFRNKINRHPRVAISNAALEPSRRGNGGGVTLERMNANFGLEKSRRIDAVEGDEQGVVGGAFADHDVGAMVGVGRNADAFALAERETV